MENVDIIDRNPFTNWALSDIIDLRKEIMNKRSELAKQDRAHKEQLDYCDELLIKYHEEHPEVSQVRGATAKVSWSEETHYNTEAGMKEEVRDWLFDNGLQHLMTWSLNRASTNEYVQMHGELPHVSPYVKKKVSCTKL